VAALSPSNDVLGPLTLGWWRGSASPTWSVSWSGPILARSHLVRDPHVQVFVDLAQAVWMASWSCAFPLLFDNDQLIASIHSTSGMPRKSQSMVCSLAW